MKKTLSLRTQLFGLMALLVFLQSLSLICALFVSRVFFMLDAEAFRLFNSITNNRVQSYNASAGQLVGNMAKQSGALSLAINEIASLAGVPPSEIYLDDELYLQASTAGAEALLDILRTNTVSGAFFIINASNANKADYNAYSAVYIRNSAPVGASKDTSNYLLEIGPIAVSQRFGITTSVNWNLDLDLADLQTERNNFYTQPMQAALQQKRAEMERYGYWSSPVDIFGDGQRDVVFSLPLLDRDGVPYGVLGFEISLPLFNQYYLPNTDLPYRNSFYTITSVDGDTADLRWFIPSSPVSQVYLNQGDKLHLERLSGAELYRTQIQGLGGMYCAVQPLQLYSRNSPFYDESWSLISFVPRPVLHETSQGVRGTLILSIALTTVLAFAAIFVLVFITTRKIEGLSSYVQSLTPYMDIHFAPTKIREIDELTAAVERLNKSVVNASKTTSKILELTLLPIGGYEISDDMNQVILTEYVYKLLQLDASRQISKAEWEEIHSRLIAHPAQAYEKIYQCQVGKGETKWLRILETATDTGKVGVILDVSKDIEEHRRLAHELDYDALTRLLNRTAFKREAHLQIKNEPGKIGAMIFSDLDNLKCINDTFGHDMGDRLIMRAGEMFRSFERYGGIVSRISGDEFAIYMHGFRSQAEAKELIYRQYRENLDYSLKTPDGSDRKIRYSSGIAFYPEDSDNVTDLLKLADFAMYEAKHICKGEVYEFNRESYQTKSYLLENREAINRLLDEELIYFVFQPIVDLRTGRIFAYEALMRPLLDNFKSPLEILSVAEAQSKLGQLERLVMFKAFAYAQEHLEELRDAKLFVNSIPSQVLTDEDFAGLGARFSDVFGKIVVEITEAENDAPALLNQKVQLVRKNNMGGLAIDDFGSGYSNEIRIISINPDIVKIDMELVSNIDTNEDKRVLVENLTSFCRLKGILTVAEGVERREELEMFVRLGIDYAQGYYVQRPQAALLPIPEQIAAEIRALHETAGTPPREQNS